MSATFSAGDKFLGSMKDAPSSAIGATDVVGAAASTEETNEIALRRISESANVSIARPPAQVRRRRKSDSPGSSRPDTAMDEDAIQALKPDGEAAELTASIRADAPCCDQGAVFSKQGNFSELALSFAVNDLEDDEQIMGGDELLDLPMTADEVDAFIKTAELDYDGALCVN